MMGCMEMLCPKGVPFFRSVVYKRVEIPQVEVCKKITI